MLEAVLARLVILLAVAAAVVYLYRLMAGSACWQSLLAPITRSNWWLRGRWRAAGEFARSTDTTHRQPLPVACRLHESQEALVGVNCLKIELHESLPSFEIGKPQRSFCFRGFVPASLAVAMRNTSINLKVSNCCWKAIIKLWRCHDAKSPYTGQAIASV